MIMNWLELSVEIQLFKLLKVNMPTQEEYIKAAEGRIQEFSKSSGEVIGNMTMTAIHAELKTMFNIGKEQSCQKQPTQ